MLFFMRGPDSFVLYFFSWLILLLLATHVCFHLAVFILRTLSIRLALSPSLGEMDKGVPLSLGVLLRVPPGLCAAWRIPGETDGRPVFAQVLGLGTGGEGQKKRREGRDRGRRRTVKFRSKAGISSGLTGTEELVRSHFSRNSDTQAGRLSICASHRSSPFFLFPLATREKGGKRDRLELGVGALLLAQKGAKQANVGSQLKVVVLGELVLRVVVDDEVRVVGKQQRARQEASEPPR